MEGKSSLILNRWGIVKTILLFVCGYISRLLTINVVVRENLEKFPTPPISHLLTFVVWRVGITDIFLYFCSTIQT